MLPKLVIEQVIHSQQERLKELGAGFPRQVDGYENLGSHALIISGIRRCGKSTLMQQIMAERNAPAIYLNFEDPRLAGFDLSDLNRLDEIAREKGILHYYLDEIQLVDQWESFVRFRIDEGCRIFITGSNASMLSKELGSKLTGRHISKELFPFSYPEYIGFSGIPADAHSVSSYMAAGGFPEFIKTGQEEVLMQGFNDILVRDIAQRHMIRNTSTLRKLAVWLVTNTGKQTTGNSLKKMFEIGSSSSIMEYLSYFEDAYLFFFIEKFSYSSKVRMVNAKKVYCVDNGFIRAVSVSFTEDLGRLLENMVYMHLRRLTPEIYYFSETKECDFVVFQKGKIKGLVQVCYQLDQNNLNRETAGLAEAMDFFNLSEGEIITLDQSDTITIDGKTIDVKPFAQWALDLGKQP